jgi:hypothetical protein
MQKCNFWKWEDELSNTSAKNHGKDTYAAPSMICRDTKEKQVSTTLHEIKAELALIRYVLVGVVIVCAWMVTRM